MAVKYKSSIAQLSYRQIVRARDFGRPSRVASDGVGDAERT